jgi:hypothetical protein
MRRVLLFALLDFDDLICDAAVPNVCTRQGSNLQPMIRSGRFTTWAR